jgi:hypothetical protein
MRISLIILSMALPLAVPGQNFSGKWSLTSQGGGGGAAQLGRGGAALAGPGAPAQAGIGAPTQAGRGGAAPAGLGASTQAGRGGAAPGGMGAPSQGGRGAAPRILVLNQAGDEATGTITPQDNRWTTGPFDGVIHGGKVDKSGTLRFHVWFLRDEPVPQVYEGKLSPDGQEIAFTVKTGEGFPPPVVKSLTPRGERNAAWPAPSQVIAKRVK